MELVTRPHEATTHQRNEIEGTVARIRASVLARLNGQYAEQVEARAKQLRLELYESRGLILPGPRAPPAQIDPQVSTAFFQELRSVTETSIWQFGYMDVVPVYFFDMDEWARKKMGALSVVWREDPLAGEFKVWLKQMRVWLPELPSPNKGVIGTIAGAFVGESPSAYSAMLDRVTTEIIRAKRFEPHGGVTPEIHFGPAVSSGELRVSFDWSPCTRRIISRGGVLHTFEIFDYILARGRWSDFEDICRRVPARLRPFVDRLRYHYFIVLQPLAARVMARVVGSIRGKIELIIADYFIEHVSPIFVTLGKYLETWNVHLDISVRADAAAKSCDYCQNTFGIPREEIISAMAIYFETAHKIYRANIPPGKTLAGGPYLPSNCITLPDLPLYRQVRALYNKYDVNYGAQCDMSISTQDYKNKYGEYVANKIAKAERSSSPRFTMILAAPGTGKSTYIKNYEKGSLMVMIDEIMEEIDLDGIKYNQSSDKFRNNLADDVDALQIAPFFKFIIKNSLLSSSRLCKQQYWTAADVVLDMILDEVITNKIPINVCMEAVGSLSDYAIYTKYARVGIHKPSIVYLRIPIEKEHRQQLGRLIIEQRVSSWYSILQFANNTLNTAKKLIANGFPADIFLVTDDPPLTQLVANGVRVNNMYSIGYLERDFNNFLREFI